MRHNLCARDVLYCFVLFCNGAYNCTREGSLCHLVLCNLADLFTKKFCFLIASDLVTKKSNVQ